MSEIRCRKCDYPIKVINYALGPKWMHQHPDAAFEDGVYEYCKGAVAAPDMACLLDASSLGAPSAKRLIESVPVEVGQEIVRRAKERRTIDACSVHPAQVTDDATAFGDMRRALELIARAHCEENSCCRWFESDMTAWCDACIAQHALDSLAQDGIESLTPSSPESASPGPEVQTHPGANGDETAPGCVQNVP
jgi:hypothetical protein